MHRKAMLALLAVLAVTVAGCGGKIQGPAVRSLSFTSNDIVDGTLYVIKDTGVFVGVKAVDVNGKSVGESSLENVDWTTDDKDVLQVWSLGATGVIKGNMDWFDTKPKPDGGTTDGGTADGGMQNGGATDAGTSDGGTKEFEPKATLTATLGDASTSVPVVVILNAAGTWNVTLDDGTAASLDLTQHGRTVTHEATGATGTIDGNTISLNFAGYTLHGTFTDRDTVSGTYTAPGGKSGTWSAKRG